MAEIASVGGGWFSLGTAAYPEGRPGTSSSELTDLLLAKQDLCSWAVTQLCFSGPVLSTYLTELRAAGVCAPRLGRCAGRRAPHPADLPRSPDRGGPVAAVRPTVPDRGGGGSLVRSVLAPSSYDPHRWSDPSWIRALRRPPRVQLQRCSVGSPEPSMLTPERLAVNSLREGAPAPS